jgi:hypothetical protein
MRKGWEQVQPQDAFISPSLLPSHPSCPPSLRPALPPSLPPYLRRLFHHFLPALPPGGGQEIRGWQCYRTRHRNLLLPPSLPPALPPALPGQRGERRVRGWRPLLPHCLCLSCMVSITLPSSFMAIPSSVGRHQLHHPGYFSFPPHVSFPFHFRS